ncbi:MAG: hypothetical protein R2688_08550 [Fimbriimonadaceae bacterium]
MGRRYWNALRGERRVLIIGAGDAGNVVAQELQHEGKRKLALAGFVDDDPAKQGQPSMECRL